MRKVGLAADVDATARIRSSGYGWKRMALSWVSTAAYGLSDSVTTRCDAHLNRNITNGLRMDNTQLHKLYREFFATASLSPEMAGRCSSPLLLSVKPSWALTSQRLFIVGQETLGWAFDKGEYYDWPYPPISYYADFSQCTSGVEALMYAYEAFAFAEHQPKNHRSPFWRTFRHMMSVTGADALWSNLFRFDVDEGSVMSNCSEAELEQVLRAQQGLLRREIQLLRPTAVVFFTGPRYDEALINEFPNTVFGVDPLSWTPEHLGNRSSRWQSPKQTGCMRRSSGGRWSSWFGADVIPRNWLGCDGKIASSRLSARFCQKPRPGLRGRPARSRRRIRVRESE